MNLSCDQDHLFEGWFGSSDAFEAQRERLQIACPACGSTAISRRPSAPYVNTGAQAPAPSQAPARTAPGSAQDALALVQTLLRRMGHDAEDVGNRFAEEARGIHYGDREARDIRGKASREDVGELLDEGILVLPLPPDEGEIH